MAEAHVSSCPRCQEVVGLIVKTAPAQPATQGSWFRVSWLVPLTAGVAAVGLWIMVPTTPPATAPEAAPTVAQFSKSVDAIAPAPAPPKETETPQFRAELKRELQQPAAVRPAESPAVDGRREPRVGSRETNVASREERRADAAPVPAAAPPASPAAVGRVAAETELSARQAVADQLRAKEATSPDGSLRWRITEKGTLERSSDRGTTWELIQTGLTVPLVEVQAPEPRIAIVTTADGRAFRTTDGGVRWEPVK